jgi:riboflavin kinase/FMN adenylyltransferase
MAVFYGTGDLPRFPNPVLTIGTFDGVHKGHQAILKDVVAHAKAAGKESVLITFEPHPRKLIYPEQSLQLLTPLNGKIQLIRNTGIDHVVVIPFNQAFSALTAEAYIRDFLVAQFHPHAIVIGYDHRFGRDRTGNLALLKSFEQAFGYTVYELPVQKIEDAAVSSTKIRNALRSGDVLTAQAMLGRCYEISGTVVHGAKMGRQLGYPTANIAPESEDQLVPANGAYTITATHQDNEYSGMLNIGVRPTVSSEPKLHIEAHLFHFSGDLYGQQISIRFIARLRDEQKFASLDDLKAQLAKDAAAAITGHQ